jgi:tetraacyldisaccharide 4'-kinase
MIGAVLDRALWPAELLYRSAVRSRSSAYDRGARAQECASIPVISIGNIGVGGAGKTPVAAWFAAQVRRLGARPAVVLRGYGLDEVQLHRELNPDVAVLTAVRRIEAVERAAADGSNVAILDDGFQHRALRRDLDVVLVSEEQWVRNRRLLPRGPWREEPAALGRADLVLVTRKTERPALGAAVFDEIAAFAPAAQTVLCRLLPRRFRRLGSAEERPLNWVHGREVVALAALADPEPFAANLRARGATVELIAFPDHHEYQAADVAGLLDRLRGRPLITTHKDAVKLRFLDPGGSDVWVLEQEVSFADDDATVVLDHVASVLRSEACG